MPLTQCGVILVTLTFIKGARISRRSLVLKLEEPEDPNYLKYSILTRLPYKLSESFLDILDLHCKRIGRIWDHLAKRFPWSDLIRALCELSSG